MSSIPRRLRTLRRNLFKRDQRWRVGNADIMLPYDHMLPAYQRAHPAYDTYFLPILTALARESEKLTLIDIGSNVGDTAAAALSTVPGLEVVAVEGAPEFGGYLRRNLRPFGDRVRIVDAFVGSPPVGSSYSAARGTGGFSPATSASVLPAQKWISAGSLLDLEGTDVVWKSDTDGMDVDILESAWPTVNQRATAIWFEYDPWLSVSDLSTTSSLIRHLAQSEREVVIYDNFGRHMLNCSGPSVEPMIADLTRWLERQRDSHVAIPYIDIWAISRGRYTQLVQDAIRGAVALSRAGALVG